MLRASHGGQLHVEGLIPAVASGVDTDESTIRGVIKRAVEKDRVLCVSAAQVVYVNPLVRE